MEIVTGLERVSDEVEKADLNVIAKSDLLSRLKEKREQAAIALNDVLGTSLSATVVSRAEPKPAVPKEEDAVTTVSPGQEFLVATDFHNGSHERLLLDGIKLEVPKGWATISDKTRRVAIKPGDNVRAVFRLKVPTDAEYTRPYWHRDDPDTESLNHIDNEKYVTLPFPPPTLRAQVQYSIARTNGAVVKNEIGATVVTPFIDDSGVQRAPPLAVVPALSVALEPGTQVISTHNGSQTTVKVGATSDLNKDVHGELRLELPAGWRSEPTQAGGKLFAPP